MRFIPKRMPLDTKQDGNGGGSGGRSGGGNGSGALGCQGESEEEKDERKRVRKRPLSNLSPSPFLSFPQISNGGGRRALVARKRRRRRRSWPLKEDFHGSGLSLSFSLPLFLSHVGTMDADEGKEEGSSTRVPR